MKVICINDRDSLGNKSQFYTKGKWYKVSIPSEYLTESHMFYIISDNGTQPAVERKNFMTLEDWRESKLNQILNDKR